MMKQILDPLVYFRLKSDVLGFMLQEQQLAAAKLQAFRAAGIEPGNYRFDDDTLTLTQVDQFGQPIPEPETPPAAPPADQPAGDS
jgi:hypothetical protein